MNTFNRCSLLSGVGAPCRTLHTPPPQRCCAECTPGTTTLWGEALSLREDYVDEAHMQSRRRCRRRSSMCTVCTPKRSLAAASGKA